MSEKAKEYKGSYFQIGYHPKHADDIADFLSEFGYRRTGAVVSPDSIHAPLEPDEMNPLEEAQFALVGNDRSEKTWDIEETVDKLRTLDPAKAIVIYASMLYPLGDINMRLGDDPAMLLQQLDARFAPSISEKNEPQT